MNKFYVTFGVDTERKNKFTRVYAETEDEARKKTFDRYDSKWSFMYCEEEFLPQIERWNLTLLEEL